MVGITLNNRYELLQKIGEGGTSIVYKAKCHLLNRYVAVKVLKEDFSSDKEYVEKFKREATAAASLSCNNIVNIYDVGNEGTINYIVLEYIAGKTLNEIIKEQGKLSWKKAVAVTKQIAKALNCAHSNNIIHRDIKPHNILVTEDGIVKVTDFGIAKASNSATITSTDKVMGSAHYLSPEQARGTAVDCKTDIYSLGIVMYEMVTGKVPFDAESPVSVALKHIQEPIIPPNNMVPDLPADLNRIILKAVEKDPNKRYASATDLISDLNNIDSKLELNPDKNELNNDFTRVMSPIKIAEDFKTAKNAGPLADEYEDDFEEEDPQSTNKKDGETPNKKLSKKKKYIIAGTLIAVLLLATLGIAYIVGLGGLSNLSKTSNSTVTVPTLIGLTQNEAQSKLDSLKLKAQFIKETSDKTAGTVTASDPSAGSSAKAGDTIRMTVSVGPKTATVPDITGSDLQSAIDAITQAGFLVGTKSYAYSDSVAKDSVISEDPVAGTKLAAKGTVSLVISKGAEIQTVTVPNLVGSTLDQAKAKVDGKLTLATSDLKTGDKTKDQIVYSQDTRSGVSVKQGGTINVVVYKYDSTMDQSVIDAAAAAAAKAKVDAATTAVVTAETSKLQTDIDKATPLVSALPDGTDKTSLTTRLGKIVVAPANLPSK